jgi:cysteine desulfurase/selenocysteine lyase
MPPDQFPPARAALDPIAIRADFPILGVRNRAGAPLIYLDSAATGLKPRPVIEAVNAYNSTYSANVARGIYEIAQRATAAYEGSRAAVAHFIGAAESSEVVFVRNATEAINLVAYSWGRTHIGAGDLIVLTEMEHHANLVPWQVLAQERGAGLEFVPVDDDGHLDLAAYTRLLEREPRLVAFSAASNMLGTINPLEQMAGLAHRAGATVLVDGAQAVPHLPVDVGALEVDFYAFSGHKLGGPTGSGALWARRETLEDMPPFLTGGDMIRNVSLRHSDWNEVPHKFEAGTPDIAAAIGLGAAVNYLEELGMTAVREHEQTLTAWVTEALSEVPGLEIYGPPDPADRVGLVSFNLAGVHPHDLAQILDRAGVAIRAGHHCAMPLHERFGLAASARASFGPYTSVADLEALLAGLREARRIFA